MILGRTAARLLKICAQDRTGALYASLDSYARVQELIDAGEAEGQILECKAPHSPQVDRGTRVHLGKAISGFANSGGGVILWGVSTDNHAHSGLDVLTQIAPIGNCNRFAQRIDRLIPQVCRPHVRCPSSRVLLHAPSDSKGVVVTYIPGHEGDPVQAIDDQQFYLRVGAEFVVMPYEVLRRMFLGTAAPDLHPVFDGRLVKQQTDGSWTIPVLLSNNSAAAARDVDISVTILNPEACDRIQSSELRDVSALNPGKRIFMNSATKPIHRGMNIQLGSLIVSMKKGKRPKRVVNIEMQILADRMRARRYVMRVQLAKRGFTVTQREPSFLY